MKKQVKQTNVNPIERYFEWYLQELKDYGYVKDFFREPETLIVADKINATKNKILKSKVKIVFTPFFPEIKLTYDYLVIWEEKAEYYFYEILNLYNLHFQVDRPFFIAHKGQLVVNEKELYKNPEMIYSYVDIKTLSFVSSRFGLNSSSVTFPIKQRMLYDNNGLYVNKIIPIPSVSKKGTVIKGAKQSLFMNSFCPARYQLTDKSGVKRIIHWPVISLLQYINSRKEIILKYANKK